jgi:hypothetical protein
MGRCRDRSYTTAAAVMLLSLSTGGRPVRWFPAVLMRDRGGMRSPAADPGKALQRQH